VVELQQQVWLLHQDLAVVLFSVVGRHLCLVVGSQTLVELGDYMAVEALVALLVEVLLLAELEHLE
jgi:hypothetical protein